VIAYATDLSTSSPKHAVRVLNAHVAFLEASSSNESISAETDDDDDVVDVSNANVTRAPVADAHVDAFHLNAATAAAACDNAMQPSGETPDLNRTTWTLTTQPTTTWSHISASARGVVCTLDGLALERKSERYTQLRVTKKKNEDGVRS
jgi:hypothetical protein